MNNYRFDRRNERRWRRANDPHRNIYTGVFILIIGVLLFADRSGVDFPSWFFSWPVLLIGIGLLSGLRHSFQRGPWFILIVIGGIFLADRISDDLYLRPYFWPIIFIAGGIFIIAGGFKGVRRKSFAEQQNTSIECNEVVPEVPYVEDSNLDQGHNDANDVIDITAIFSGVKKNVLSKNFRGGDIVAFMGGAEVNLTKADCKGKIIIDNFTMFGGTKLFVPPDWDVQSNIVAIFGGVDDKRPPTSFQNLSKVVYLEGTCIFGGIEIRSY